LLPLDVTFIIDQFVNETDDNSTNWPYIQTFLTEATLQLNVGSSEGQSHVAWITYSNSSTLEFNFNPYGNDSLNVTDMIALFRSKVSAYGPAYLAQALQVMRTDVYTGFEGDREEVPNLVVIVTARDSDNASAVRNAAAQAYNEIDMLRMMVVIIGNGTNQTEMESLATENYFFQLSSFEELRVSFATLMSRICSAAYTAGTGISDKGFQFIHSLIV
jgi:hypothetical protein